MHPPVSDELRSTVINGSMRVFVLSHNRVANISMKCRQTGSPKTSLASSMVIRNGGRNTKPIWRDSMRCSHPRRLRIVARATIPDRVANDTLAALIVLRLEMEVPAVKAQASLLTQADSLHGAMMNTMASPKS